MVGSFQETADRFALRLGSDKKMSLTLNKEMYEKLGVEGRRLDKCASRFVVELDLASASLQSPEHKFRARLVENASNLFKERPLCFVLSCSASASSQLETIFPNLEPLAHKIRRATQAKTRTMAMETPLHRIPEAEVLEDFGLWVGSITSGANNLGVANVDPFISVCPIPGDGPERNVLHLALKSPIVPILPLAESIEQLLEAITDHDYFVLVGRSAGGSGFLMLVDPLQNFLFVSNQ